MGCRSVVSVLTALLAGACFSAPPSATSTSSTSSTTTGPAESDGSSTVRPGSESAGSSTTSTGTTSPVTTLPPQTTGTSGSSTGEDTTGADSTGQPISCDDADYILYLAFDGEALEHSNISVDNAPERMVADPMLEGRYGPYLGPDRHQLLDAVRGHFAPFELCVTDEEPDAAEYDMLVITSDTSSEAGSLGQESLDCGNVRSNNVNVLFLSEKFGPGASKRPLLISNFAGRFYGLETLGPDTPFDIMNQSLSETEDGATFTESCVPVDLGVCLTSALCQAAHQSAVARLNDAFE